MGAGLVSGHVNEESSVTDHNGPQCQSGESGVTDPERQFFFTINSFLLPFNISFNA